MPHTILEPALDGRHGDLLRLCLAVATWLPVLRARGLPRRREAETSVTAANSGPVTSDPSAKASTALAGAAVASPAAAVAPARASARTARRRPTRARSQTSSATRSATVAAAIQTPLTNAGGRYDIVTS